jgi:hypothetical protein
MHANNDWQAMSNQELNREIAEKVFGWSDFWVYPSAEGYYGRNPSVEGARWRIPDYAGNEHSNKLLRERMKEIWDAEETDEKHFWQFVDCRSHGWRVDVCFEHHDGDVPSLSVADKSLERAICIAALMAVELVWKGPRDGARRVPSNLAA